MKPAAALLLLSGCFLWHTGAEARCPADIVVRVQDDVTAAARCTSARSLRIQTVSTVDVRPLHLQTVTGDLVIGPGAGADAYAFERLVRIGGALVVRGNNGLRGLYLPRLEVAGRITVDDNHELMTIALPRLTAVAGALTVTGNHRLELLAAPALARVGGDLVIVGHPSLGLVELGRLSRAGGVRIEDDPKLPAEVADALRAKTAIP